MRFAFCPVQVQVSNKSKDYCVDPTTVIFHTCTEFEPYIIFGRVLIFPGPFDIFENITSVKKIWEKF